jgi:hypothetical protein
MLIMSKRTLFLLCICVSVLGACSWANRKLSIEDDHPIEQIIEAVIQDQLDLEIDLTPESEDGHPACRSELNL